MLERQSDSSILENQLGLQFIHWNIGGFTGHDFPEWAYGTLLHIAAALAKPFFVELLIEKGANTNAIAGDGFTILHSAVDCYEYATIASRLEVLKLLVEANAYLNPLCVAETPLQAAISRGHNIAIIRFLLEAGADVNGVGNDEAVIIRIRHDYRGGGRDHIDNMIHERGGEHYYDTPLRIAENKRNTRALIELLESHGAKSLHLFPVKDLPGYAEADMKTISEDSEDEVEASSEG